MTIFLESKRQPYRDTIERFIYMLQVVEKEPQTKFKVMCALQTNYDVIERYLKLATRYNLIRVENKMITITDKGRKVLFEWMKE